MSEASYDDYERLRENPEIIKLTKLLEEFSLRKEVAHYFNGLAKPERKSILKDVRKSLCVIEQKPLLLRVFASNGMPDAIRNEVVCRYLDQGSSPEKTHQWLELVLNIPFGKYAPQIDISTLCKSKAVLDEGVFGHDTAKHKLISYIGQLVRNQSSSGLILGLKSYPGIGKTSLVERGVSRLLNRPFFNISLGGVHDSSFLRGFQFTYEGSEPGFITRSLISGGIMNPIIFFDELDKVSTTSKGDEIINTLIQITDPIQSKYFQDRYLGSTITLDISQCIIIFAYNSRDNINSILLDRISEVELSGFSTAEKFTIAKDHLIPSIVKDIGLPDDKVIVTERAVEKVIVEYTNEAGVRHLKQVLYEVFRDINTKMLLQYSEEKPAKRQRKSKDDIFTINEQNIKKYITTYKPEIITTVKDEGRIGRVNGLYVTAHGDSGIIPIEVDWFPSSEAFGILFTGNLGKVMGESVHVAKSVAWLSIPNRVKKNWIDQWNKGKLSIHVHCSDTSTPKEGPSAGVALSLAIWSLLMKKVIPPKIAITGEMTLGGDITEIGGLKEKLEGAKRAKCELVLLPKENIKDIPVDCKDLKLLPLSSFDEVLKVLEL